MVALLMNAFGRMWNWIGFKWYVFLDFQAESMRWYYSQAREIASAVRWLHSQADIVLHNDIRAVCPYHTFWNVLISYRRTSLLRIPEHHFYRTSGLRLNRAPLSEERLLIRRIWPLNVFRWTLTVLLPSSRMYTYLVCFFMRYVHIQCFWQSTHELQIFSDGLVPYNGLDVDTIVKTRSERPNPPRSMEASMTDAIWGLIETCWADCEKRILMTVVCDLLGNV